MDPIAEIEQELKIIKQRLTEMQRFAKVIAIDPETARLTVVSEGLKQRNVPFFTMRAGEDQTYWMPSIGELGLLMAPCGLSANAIFMPAIFYTDYPPGDISLTTAKRIFRDGTVEEVDTENSHYKLTIGPDGVTERLADTEQIQDKHGENLIKIDADEILIDHASGDIKIDDTEISVERSTGTIKIKVGNNLIEINAFALNLLGALIFPTGITAFQSAVGPIIFSKAATTPGATPTADPATKPGDDGSATEIPAQRVRNVAVEVGSSLQATVGSLPVTGTAGTVPVVGTVTPGTYPLQVTGTFHIQLPAKKV